MPPILILTGFEPFRGERINPSWEVARGFDGDVIGGLQIKSVRVPVGCAKAARRITGAIVRYRPRAVIGLGEAGGRPAISLERIAINLADERGALSKKRRPRIHAGRSRRTRRVLLATAVARDHPRARSPGDSGERVAERRRLRVQRADVRGAALLAAQTCNPGGLHPPAVRRAPGRPPSQPAQHGAGDDGEGSANRDCRDGAIGEVKFQNLRSATINERSARENPDRENPGSSRPPCCPS